NERTRVSPPAVTTMVRTGRTASVGGAFDEHPATSRSTSTMHGTSWTSRRGLLLAIIVVPRNGGSANGLALTQGRTALLRCFRECSDGIPILNALSLGHRCKQR